MILQTLYILLLFMITWTAPFSLDSSVFNQKGQTPRRCSHFKDHGMMAVDCYGLDLTSVPQNLRTDTEVCFFFKLNFIWVSWVPILPNAALSHKDVTAFGSKTKN
jgi:hypothetical protein